MSGRTGINDPGATDIGEEGAFTPAVPASPRPGGPRARAVALPVVALVAAAVFPLLNSNPYILGVAILLFVYAVVTQAWNLVLGIAGILSFAQMAFFAVGAYTAAIFNLDLGLSPWLCTLLGGITAVLASLIVGLPALRLRGVYVVLLTLAFQTMLTVLIQTDSSGLTGGVYGLSGVAPYLPLSMGFRSQLVGTYYLALALVAVVSFLIYRIIKSPLGLGLIALRDAEEVAANRGVNPSQYKLLAFGVSAFFTGLAGAFYAHYYGIITPAAMDFGLTMNLLAMIVVGGLGAFAGPIIGTALLSILSELLQGVGQYRLVILGLILVVVIVVAPQGLVGLLAQAMRSVSGVRRNRRHPTVRRRAGLGP